ncbi:MAG: ABC transporter permease [Bosea sp. (in: a-proteobacteria)]
MTEPAVSPRGGVPVRHPQRPHELQQLPGANLSNHAHHHASRPAAGGVTGLHGSRRLDWVQIAALLIAALVALPLITVLLSLAGPYGEALSHLASTILGEVMSNTLVMGLLVGVGTTLLGVGTAWLVAACRFPGSRQFEWLLILPLAMPAYIIGYAYMDLMDFAGPLQSWIRDTFGLTRGDYWFPTLAGVGGASLMFTLVLYPYVYLLARSAFVEQSACIVDAARALGARPHEAFWKISLPLARPAIAAGVALALMETLADFGMVQYFGVLTFTTVIFRTWFGMGDPVAAAQLASGLLIFVLALLLLEQHSRSNRRFARTTRRARDAAPYRLRGSKAALAMTACALPVVFGFVVPVLVFLKMQIKGGDALLSEQFLVLARNSLLLAVSAAVLITAVGALLAYALRVSRSTLTRGAVRFATMGYAMPGTVIAVGVLIPFGLLDNVLDSFMRANLGISTGLLLSGTLAALMLAYLVRFLAVAMQSIMSGYARIGTSLDDAARLLGDSPAQVIGRIHSPLLSRSLITAGALVFVDVMKELPATLIVRPFNFDTLAVRVYSFASDERLTQASTSALAIVAVGIIPVVLLSRSLRANKG